MQRMLIIIIPLVSRQLFGQSRAGEHCIQGGLDAEGYGAAAHL